MSDLHRLDRKKLEAVVAQSPFKTMADFEQAREAYPQSDNYLKNRKSIFIKPFVLGIKTEDLMHLSKEELALADLKYTFKHELKGVPKDKLPTLEREFMFHTTLIPPPVDLYITEADAIRIFGLTRFRLKLHRDLGLLNTKVHQQQIHYIWTELKELFS